MIPPNVYCLACAALKRTSPGRIVIPHMLGCTTTRKGLTDDAYARIIEAVRNAP